VCYHDVIARNGHFPRTKTPGVIGHEVAGEIAEIGAAVTEFKVGDRVLVPMSPACGKCRLCRKGRPNLCQSGGGLFGEEVPGGYAEYMPAPESCLVRLPDAVSMAEASIVPCAIGTAYHALFKVGGLRPAETVLITGATGGVGIHAVQIAHMAGARVLAVTSSAAKADFLRQQGADEVLVSPELNFNEEARDLTGGHGVDVVVNIVGQIAWNAALKSLDYGGRHIFVGNLNAQPVQLRPAHAILKELSLLGTDAVTLGEIEEILRLIDAGKLKPVVDGTMPLEQAAEAHRMLEDRQVLGRLVLTP
ncbi:MAG: zinc-binding dehydrogenase, partial [Alphaproteobacteria bacterium]